jgi:hypothetical protein
MATKTSRSLAVLATAFLVLTLYGRHWSQVHGAFCERKINIPLALKEQSSIEIHFAVAEDGPHYVELRYQHSGSFDVASALQDIQGTCILRRNRQTLIQSRLPTHDMIGGNDSLGTILIQFDASRSSHYSLALKIDHVPVLLRGVSSMLRIEIDPRSYKTLGAIMWLTSGAAVASLICMVTLIYALYTTPRGGRRLWRRWEIL